MSVLRDIALILLMLQGFLCALIPVAILAAVNYGLYRSRWWRGLPRFLARAYDFVLRVRERVNAGARAAATPVFFFSQSVAALRGVLGIQRPFAEFQTPRGGQR